MKWRLKIKGVKSEILDLFRFTYYWVKYVSATTKIYIYNIKSNPLMLIYIWVCIKMMCYREIKETFNLIVGCAVADGHSND